MSRPVVRQFMICRRVEPSPGGDALVLTDPLTVVQMPKGRVKGHVQKEFALYFQLSDGLGEFDLCAAMWSDHAGPALEGKPIVRTRVMRQAFTDKLTVVEVAFKLEEVPFPKPALYEFVIRASGEILRGETGFIRVLLGA